MLKLYNTLTRKKETFKQLKNKKVGMYTCGPTVYDFAHIGNFRAYCVADILQRYLKYQGYKVKWIMNITDIDDKTIAGAQKAKIPLDKFTSFYKKAFFFDLEKLNIEKANKYPEATKYIPEMVNLVKKLLNKGYAYKSNGSIYFKLSSFKNYGHLARIDLSQIKPDVRIDQDQYEKENVEDFVLWKAKKEREPSFKTEIGEGRPGWHLECSVMSTKYLGQPFDIHTGGIDLIFPHHQNEIAQSEAGYGKRFVNFWFHNEHLLVEGQKMAKSLGNFYTLKDLEKKNYNPLALRYLFLTAQYRDPLNFTFKSLEAAEKTLQNLKDFMQVINLGKFPESKQNLKIGKILTKTKKDFEKALNNDLNTPKALAVIFEMTKNINKGIDRGKFSKEDQEKVKKTVEEFDSVLGFLEKLGKQEELNEDFKALIKERERARQAKDWAKADAIRDQLEEEGIELEDTPQGPRWKIIKKR